MNDERTSVTNPIGLYRDPESKKFVGAIDPIQADAMVHMGFELHTEGREAAMTPQAELDRLEAGGDLTPEEGGETYDPKAKKGDK